VAALLYGLTETIEKEEKIAKRVKTSLRGNKPSFLFPKESMFSSAARGSYLQRNQGFAKQILIFKVLELLAKACIIILTP
jgi:hypothetical protein